MTFVGIPGRSSDADYTKFVNGFGLTHFDNAIDTDGQIWAAFGVSYQPAWVFIDADGEYEVVAGALGEAALRERMQELLA